LALIYELSKQVNQMPRQPHFALAFDFGGTKLAAGLVDITSGEILNLVRQPAPSEQGAEVCLQSMVDAGSKILEISNVLRSDILGIGISFGGIVSQDHRTVIKSMHVKNWDDFPLPERISKLFELPAYMENDGNAAALGERVFGAGKGTENMLYVQISTGVGSGLILNNRLFRGESLAGEFGHMTVIPNGPDCACGKKGCIESLTSGWALKKYALEAFNNAAPDSALFRLGSKDPKKIDAELLIQAFREKDPQAVEIITRGFQYLGLGISNAVALIDPRIVVLGGGITRAWDVLVPVVSSAMEEFLPPLFRDGRVRLEHSKLNGSETLLGAAMLTTGFAD
jgi:glucokinase